MSTSSEPEPLRPLSDSQRETLEEATSTYQAAVTEPAATYLNRRGIDPANAAMFRLGVVADPLPGHERFRGFLAIPYLDHRDRPLGLRFRCLAEHDHRAGGHGKYMSEANTPARMFNVRAIHRAADVIHVCEGELDAIILAKLGLHAVALPGALAWQPRHRRMLAGFSRVWVWGDPDDAGADLIGRIVRSHRAAKGVRLRHGDVTDTYLHGGGAALLGLVA